MSVEVKYWYLRNHKLFSTLSNSQISDLCIITRFKKANKGEIIYFADEPVQRIYFLKKGMIKIVEADKKGDEIIKDIIQQGDLFGEITLNNASKSHEYAQAMSSEVMICTFTLEDFEKLLEINPALALKFYKFVGFKFKRLQNRYANLVFKDVRSRLIDFLKEWAEREGETTDEGVLLHNYLTHQDIANLVCSTRQTITQLMNELEVDGKIQYSRKEIIFTDLQTLA
jgi:CRP/FNR family transcriptional regulator